jgi:hypothetical protein
MADDQNETKQESLEDGVLQQEIAQESEDMRPVFVDGMVGTL